MKIAVVGTGYVGLVTGTCFAETGNDVFCIDIDANKVKKLANGEITIYEPGLEKLFLRNMNVFILLPVWKKVSVKLQLFFLLCQLRQVKTAQLTLNMCWG